MKEPHREFDEKALAEATAIIRYLALRTSEMVGGLDRTRGACMAVHGSTWQYYYCRRDPGCNQGTGHLDPDGHHALSCNYGGKIRKKNRRGTSSQPPPSPQAGPPSSCLLLLLPFASSSPAPPSSAGRVLEGLAAGWPRPPAPRSRCAGPPSPGPGPGPCPARVGAKASARGERREARGARRGARGEGSRPPTAAASRRIARGPGFSRLKALVMISQHSSQYSYQPTDSARHW